MPLRNPEPEKIAALASVCNKRVTSLTIRIAEGDPHPLDAEILRLASELRRLIHQRAGYFKSRAHKGKARSQAQRDAIAEKMRGRVVSDETKARLSAAHTGRKLTPAHRAAMSRAKRAA